MRAGIHEEHEMAILTSRVRAQGGSVVTTIPAEAARRMGICPGADLFWVEDGTGGYRVTAFDPARVGILRAHDAVMDEYRDVFASLAR
jgi:hypothetical protein